MTAEVIKTLGRMEPADRLHIYVQLNSYEWPDILAELKPSGWDAMTDTERYNNSEQRGVWKVLYEMTSAFDRSQTWWLEKLGQTKEAHLEWWLLTGRSYAKT